MLEAGKVYECFAERAEMQLSKPDENTGEMSLYVKMTYVFPATGDRLDAYHTLVKKDGTVASQPVDRNDPEGPQITEQAILERRYGVNLSEGEFDNTKLSPDIKVRALIGEETNTWRGKTSKRLRIRRIYGNESQQRPADKATIMSRFGSILRASHADAARLAPTVSAPNSPPPKGAERPATPPTPKAPPAAPKASQRSAKAAPPAAPSNIDECWNLFTSLDSNKGIEKEALYQNWYALIEETFGHRNQEQLDERSWGTLKERLVSMEKVPF